MLQAVAKVKTVVGTRDSKFIADVTDDGDKGRPWYMTVGTRWPLPAAKSCTSGRRVALLWPKGGPRFRSNHEPTHVRSTFLFYRRFNWSEAQNDTLLLRTRQQVPNKAWQRHVQSSPVSSGYL